MSKDFGTALETLLKSDKRLVAKDGSLLKNKVQELAGQYDPALLELLFGNTVTNEHFFIKLKSTSVFKKDKFLQFLNAKEWLPDSYTAFKNRIGLSADGKLLTESAEVVVDWAFKDCVLEGGMKEEEANRKEVFYNEILAPSEINRLLEPKAFKNALRISNKGQETLKAFKVDQNGTPIDNLVIRGNNLLALHSIADVYSNHAKMIYIDPPYNRDADSFYNDSFKRSTWLTFMKNRLEIARKLLSKNGVICIQIDETQFAYLKVLADEVFKQNHLNTVVVKMSESSGVKMSHVGKRLPKVKEYILIYAKDLEFVKLNSVRIKKKINAENDNYLKYYSQIIENPGADVEEWKIVPIKEYISRNNIKFTNKEEEIKFKIDNAERLVYRTNNSELSKLHFNVPLKKVTSATGLEYIWWEGKQLLILSDYLSEGLVDLWTDISTINLNKEGGVDFPNGKKPELLIQRLIELFTNPGDLVIDYHLGSGTTAAVAHKMNRRYIGIEQLNYKENDAIVRLKNVIAGDASGISKLVSWNGGGEFVYFELAERNPNILESIGKATTINQLFEVWEELSASPYLVYKIDIAKVNKEIENFKNLPLRDAKAFLIEAIDKNAIYVNISELEDKTNGLTKDDIATTKSFYGI